MMASAGVATRSQTEIYLIGSTSEDITGAKLPSTLQAIRCFFYFHSDMKMTVRESCTKAIDIVLSFWAKAGIPCKPKQHAISKLEALFNTWKNIQRNRLRRSDSQIQKEEKFSVVLQELFDIAHQDALAMITIQEDKDFLIAQRESRRGCMASVDVVKWKKEEQKRKKEQAVEKRLKICEAQKRKFDETVEWESSSNSGDEHNNDNMEANCAVDVDSGDADPHTPSRCSSQHRQFEAKVMRKNVLTPELAAALDRCNISDRKAVHIAAAAAVSLGHEASSLAISRSTISRARMQNRTNLVLKLKDEFATGVGDIPLTVHWDGKLLPDLTGKEKVDRLPILVSGAGVDQLLKVPKLPNGTGEATAMAVFAAIEDWGLNTRICGMAFDTTSSNTGLKSGACTLIEQKLGKRLLSFACRHHIHEIVLEKVFSLTLAPSSGPEIQMFKRFQNSWAAIDQGSFRTGLHDAEVAAKITVDKREEVLIFVQQQLEEQQPREDYRELLKLVVIFLGGIPPGGIRFRAPAGLHRARWMARLLYGFKIFMFGYIQGQDGQFIG